MEKKMCKNMAFKKKNCFSRKNERTDEWEGGQVREPHAAFRGPTTLQDSAVPTSQGMLSATLLLPSQQLQRKSVSSLNLYTENTSNTSKQSQGNEQ